MENLGHILKQALVEKKSPADVSHDLATVLDSHIFGFSVKYAEAIAQASSSQPDLMHIKKIAYAILRSHRKDIHAFITTLEEATKFVGIGDSVFPRYAQLNERIEQDLVAIENSFEEIGHQIELTKAFIQLHEAPAPDTHSSTKHASFVPQPQQKKSIVRSKQHSPKQPVEKITTQGVLSRLTQLGLQITQPAVIKKFEKLPDTEKMKLDQYLTTVESYTGKFWTSPYVTALKNIPYLALKFSYGTSAYRIICHKDTHEITDVCPHDEYEKSYLIS